MKKELQKIIKEMKADVFSAQNIIDLCRRNSITSTLEVEGVQRALEKYIPKLTLLLDSENEKSSQSSQGDGSNSSNAM